jgi:hypothetical protein
VHSRSVALVLSLQMGMASPQFHVAFDDLFETVKGGSGNPNHSLWQQITRFKRAMPSKGLQVRQE